MKKKYYKFNWFGRQFRGDCWLWLLLCWLALDHLAVPRGTAQRFNDDWSHHEIGNAISEVCLTWILSPIQFLNAFLVELEIKPCKETGDLRCLPQ